jgi:hypothetical protein
MSQLHETGNLRSFMCYSNINCSVGLVSEIYMHIYSSSLYEYMGIKHNHRDTQLDLNIVFQIPWKSIPASPKRYRNPEMWTSVWNPICGAKISLFVSRIVPQHNTLHITQHNWTINTHTSRLLETTDTSIYFGVNADYESDCPLNADKSLSKGKTSP